MKSRFSRSGSLAFVSGKWYAEFKYLDGSKSNVWNFNKKYAAENKRNDEYVD